MSRLFSPIKVGRYTLSHRIALAPMTRLRTVQPGDIRCRQRGAANEHFNRLEAVHWLLRRARSIQ